MKLRVGLIGLGDSWESRYLPALRALADRFEVRAICHQVAHRAQQVARELGISAVDGFQAVAAREDIDALLLLSPQWYGALPILAACEHGKAIYCTASLDFPADEADEIRRRVEQSGIAFMVEFARRQAPATLRLKELLATRLGKPRMLFCHQRLGEEPSRKRVGNHRGTSLADRDPTMHSMVELVDWCCYVVGTEPTQVVGTRRKFSAEEDAIEGDQTCNSFYEMLSLDFSAPDQPEGGPVAQISSGRYIPSNWPEALSFRPPADLQIACDRGIAFVDLPSTLIWFDTAGRHMESLESERPVGEQLLVQFHRSVTSLVRNTSGLQDAYRALSIVMAARESHAQGRRVSLVEPEG